MSQQAEVLARRMDRMEGLLGQTLGRTPTLSEIAAKVSHLLHLSNSEIQRMPDCGALYLVLQGM